MAYVPRLTAPKKDNKNYYSKQNPFYPTYVDNCTWFANGRMQELGKNTKGIPTSNAENWFNDYNGKKGQTPKEGAIGVWKQGKRHKASDGMGHVAVLEIVDANGKITTSNSGVNSKFYLKELKPPYKLSGKEFEGFIYPEDLKKVPEPIKEEPKKESSAEYYVIKKGDNLTRIAKVYNTSIDKLMKLNPQIKNKNIIYAGQKIRVK